MKKNAPVDRSGIYWTLTIVVLLVLLALGMLLYFQMSVPPEGQGRGLTEAGVVRTLGLLEFQPDHSSLLAGLRQHAGEAAGS